ncbi:hypothetical protein COV94_01610, partial [Candidatus Woesearchaeota archaeon CG11_big_fil_rev_8_21_14_0_20_57_5]
TITVPANITLNLSSANTSAGMNVTLSALASDGSLASNYLNVSAIVQNSSTTLTNTTSILPVPAYTTTDLRYSVLVTDADA